MRAHRRHPLGAIVPLLGALACAGVQAQVSGTVTLASDYRFRGVSLSNDQPALQADVGVDDPSGLYGGLFASSVRLDDRVSAQGLVLAYAGYARRVRDGLSVDAGASYAGFTGQTDYDYGEVHAGFTTERLDGHLYYAPDYFGQGRRTLYAELDGAQPVRESIRLVWHAGMLWIAGGPPTHPRTNADARAGVEFTLPPLRLQLARVLNQGPEAAYPVYGQRDHGAWVATLSFPF